MRVRERNVKEDEGTKEEPKEIGRRKEKEEYSQNYFPNTSCIFFLPYYVRKLLVGGFLSISSE